MFVKIGNAIKKAIVEQVRRIVADIKKIVKDIVIIAKAAVDAVKHSLILVGDVLTGNIVGALQAAKSILKDVKSAASAAMDAGAGK